MARGTSPHPRPKLGKAKFLHDFLGVPRGRNQSDASEWVAGVALSKRRPGIVSARVCRCVPRSKVHLGAPGATSAKISCAVAEQGRRQIAACDAQSCAWPEEPQITSQGIKNYNCGSASEGIADFLPPGTADVQALPGKLLHLEAVFGHVHPTEPGSPGRMHAEVQVISRAVAQPRHFALRVQSESSGRTELQGVAALTLLVFALSASSFRVFASLGIIGIIIES